MSIMLTVDLPRQLQIGNLHRIVELFLPTVHACNQKQTFEIVVNMGDLGFVRPSGLAALSAIMVYVARSGYLKQGYVATPRSSDVDGYLARMDFYEFLKMPTNYPWSRRNSEGRFHEVIEVTSEEMCQEVTTDLGTILQSQMDMTEDAIYATTYALSELMENVFHHAHSPVNAIVCAQTYPSSREIELAIVDCGRGFRLSLSENPKLHGRFDTATEAINLALQRKVTGRPGSNAGEGLFFIKEVVEENMGDMAVYSEDGLLEMVGGRGRLYDVPYWQGSIVSLCLKTDRSVDLTGLFNRYAPPEKDYKIVFDSDEEEVPF